MKPGRDGDEVWFSLGSVALVVRRYSLWLAALLKVACPGTARMRCILAPCRGDLEPRNMFPRPQSHLAQQKWLYGLPWGLQRDFGRGFQERFSLLAAGKDSAITGDGIRAMGAAVRPRVDSHLVLSPSPFRPHPTVG